MLTLTFNTQPVKANPATIVVPDNYPTIQEAINHASGGDTIYVKEGIYSENLTINKESLKILAENKGCFILGKVIVETDNVWFSGFTIEENGQFSNSGIFLNNVDNCNISNNAISNTTIGISIYHSPSMLEGTYGRNYVYGNVLVNNNIGIFSSFSMGIPPQVIYGDNIYENRVVNNSYGILVTYDISLPNVGKTYGGNIICGNTLLGNVHGFYLNYSLGSLYLENSEIIFGGNIIRGNNVTNNGYVMEVYCEEITNLITYGNVSLIFGNDTIFNNCLINNENIISASIRQITNWVLDTLDGKIIKSGLENWDAGYPLGGNYWSDYNGVDSNYDGICDFPYIINANNIDYYPLMGMYSSFNTSYDYEVGFVSNSSIANFDFSLLNPSQVSLSFNVTGAIETRGFCRICIPKALINGSYVVKFNGEVITNTTYPQVRELPCSNETYEYLYINYTHSKHRIEVGGTTTIPEFPSFLILPLFIIATLLAVIVYRRKHTVRQI
jgi:parallel beta-helix repeat protein